MAEPGSDGERLETFSTFTRRTWVAIAATASVVVLLLVLWRLAQVLLLVFAGVLMAVLLRGLTRPLARRIPFGETVALMFVIMLIILALMAVSVLLAPGITEQVRTLSEALPAAAHGAIEFLRDREWGTWIIDRAPEPDEVAGSAEGLFSNFFGVFSTALGAIANVLFILVLAVYLAANPAIYWRGIVLLVPARRRARAQEIVQTLGDQLWHWLTGQFIMMAIVGTLTGIGLSIAGVPLALALGVIAGIFEFVPIVGPFAAAIPGILIALAHSPTTGLYAVIVYLTVQQLEGNLLTPLVMRQMVSLPPALTLSATIIAGVLFGLPGVLFATPLALVTVILIRMIYINDVLGDNIPPTPNYKKSRS